MVINSTGKVADDKQFITSDGNYLLKLVKWEEDGYTPNGDQKFKINCDAKKIDADGQLSGTYSFNYQMVASEKGFFTIARLRDALKSPEVFDLNDWMQRFVNASIYMEQADNGKSYARVGGFEYSKFNDKLPPIQEAKEVHSEPTSNNVQTPHEIDIDEDEIPF